MDNIKSESMAFIPMKEYEELKQQKNVLAKLVYEKKPIVIRSIYGYNSSSNLYYFEDFEEHLAKDIKKLSEENQEFRKQNQELRKENEKIIGRLSYNPVKPKKWYQILFNL